MMKKLNRLRHFFFISFFPFFFSLYFHVFFFLLLLFGRVLRWVSLALESLSFHDGLEMITSFSAAVDRKVHLLTCFSHVLILVNVI